MTSPASNCTSRSTTSSTTRAWSNTKKEKADRGEARVENLNELVSAARGFEPDGFNAEEEALPPLESFLAHAVLNPAKARPPSGKTASR